MRSEGRFELKQDEETGRLYWYGAQTDWKDATEVGTDGVLTLDAKHFAVGTVLVFMEPQAGLGRKLREKTTEKTTENNEQG